jgi:hypothetical protein
MAHLDVQEGVNIHGSSSVWLGLMASYADNTYPETS